MKRIGAGDFTARCLVCGWMGNASSVFLIKIGETAEKGPVVSDRCPECNSWQIEYRRVDK